MGDTELMAVLMSVLVYETSLACVRCVRAQRECENPRHLLACIIRPRYYNVQHLTNLHKPTLLLSY